MRLRPISSSKQARANDDVQYRQPSRQAFRQSTQVLSLMKGSERNKHPALLQPPQELSAVSPAQALLIKGCDPQSHMQYSTHPED
ncbi:hypothetical protein SKAU_G00043200 [Synaphobranchus kaupii]|uniref:Uncharacterized protein n=1 Tax=Synaphobranchus kaupii TaxID=118154 RepID=A0A9Q1J908_SYNKA|nr:hypothetical protein SKAU_G00043200 [Synaphobranchus kaupii]